MDNELLEAIRTVVHEAVKAELEPIKERLDTMDGRFDKVDERFNTVDRRIGKLEAVAKEINLNVKHIWKDIELLGDGIDNLKEKTKHIV